MGDKALFHYTDYPYTPNVDSHITLVEEKPKKKSMMATVTVSIALITILVGFLLFLMYSYVRNVEISNVHVTGNLKLEKDTLISLIEIALPARYFDVNTHEIKERFMNYPLVLDAKISKTIGGKLKIWLDRTLPVVGVFVEHEGNSVPVYFDSLGRCVQVGVGLGIVDVPVLSGVKIVNPKVGVVLPPWLQEFTSQLDAIRIENPQLLRKVSEFSVQELGQNYRVLRISFLDIDADFITEMHINSTILSSIWVFINNIYNLEYFKDFDYFDVRQGVIIGKKGIINETQ